MALLVALILSWVGLYCIRLQSLFKRGDNYLVTLIAQDIMSQIWLLLEGLAKVDFLSNFVSLLNVTSKCTPCGHFFYSKMAVRCHLVISWFRKNNSNSHTSMYSRIRKCLPFWGFHIGGWRYARKKAPDFFNLRQNWQS